MVGKLVKFRDSEIKKSIDPTSDVLSSIDTIETALYEAGIYDESVETMLISSYHLTYKKNGKDVLLIRPFKADWNMKIFGTGFNLQHLVGLPIELEFEMNHTGWRIHGLVDINEEKLTNALIKAFKVTSIDRLILYPLTIIYAYYLKNPSLFQLADEQTVNEVVEAFWSGNIEKIKQLAMTSSGTAENSMKEYITHWLQFLEVNMDLREQPIHSRMRIGKEEFLLLLSSLQTYMQTIFSNYKTSLSSIWFDDEALRDKETFHQKMEEDRRTIVLTQLFYTEMKQVRVFIEDKKAVYRKSKEFDETESIHNLGLSDDRNSQEIGREAPLVQQESSHFNKPIEPEVEEEEEEEANERDWFEIIVNNKGFVQNLPFRTKKEIFGEKSSDTVTINEYRVDMLIKQILNEKRMAKEFKRIIKIIIQYCNEEGYVETEYLKDLFLYEYNNPSSVIDFAMRYGIKKALVRQNVTQKFYVILDHLRKHGLIKEGIAGDTEHLYWNFAVFVHEE